MGVARKPDLGVTFAMDPRFAVKYKSRTKVGQYTSSLHLHSPGCSPEATWVATVTVSDIYGLDFTVSNREVFEIFVRTVEWRSQIPINVKARRSIQALSCEFLVRARRLVSPASGVGVVKASVNKVFM